jgi:type I restriction enzyme, S subunit
LKSSAMVDAFTKRFTVGDIAAPIKNALVGGPFGSNLVSADYVPVGIPVIRGQNMGYGRWVDGEFAFVTPDKAKALAPNTARPGDLIFTQRGTLGQVAIVPNGKYDKYIVSQSQMKLTPDPARVDTLFLYYLFTTEAQQDHIRQNAIQTGVPHTNLGILRTTPVQLPPVAEQRAISEILGALDDKIELNRRMNETLEAMARALFKSWFVDFEPVRAKAEGRQPAGMDAETAALFSDEFEDTTIGQLPSGWKVSALGEIATNRRDGILPDEIDPSTPYIGLEHMPRGSISLGEWGLASEITSNKSRFSQGDILFGKLRPYFRKVGVANVDGVCSTDILVIAPKTSEWFGFVLGHVSSAELIDAVNAASTGTKMPRASWNDIARQPVALPSAHLAQAYNALLQPMIAKIAVNLYEGRNLAAIRDVLLPRLMSGELLVDQAIGVYS